MANDKQSGGVTIGNVKGGIHASTIAGRDVSNATIILGGNLTPANKEPTVDELKQLLAEILEELSLVLDQEEVLKEVSPAALFTARGAEQSIKNAAEKVEPAMKPEEAKSMQKYLAEAAALLSVILDGAMIVAKKAAEVASVVKPIADELEPLVEKVGVATLWVAKLWLR